MKKLFLITGLLFATFLSATNYYVSPTGNDTNDGTKENPKFNISAFTDKALPGDTIFVLPGTYNYNKTIRLTNKGTADKRICIFGTDYTTSSERPVLNFKSQGPGDSNRGFFLDYDRDNQTYRADYWYIKGLIIQEAGDNGIKIEGNYNIIEFCDLVGCYDSGIQIGLAKNSEHNDGSSAYNYIKNCDSYNNCDSHKSGGNADGFACKLFCGPGNVFDGCRAWNNSDDGWDMYSNELGVLMIDCWTWHNGDKNTLRDGKAGNGNGFKLGGNSTYSKGSNICIRCIGFDLHYVGGAGKCFDQNDNQGTQIMLNCVAFDNIKGFSFASGPSAGHVIKNCIAWKSTDKMISDQSQNATENNSWQMGNTSDKKNGGIANYDDFTVDFSDNTIANNLAKVVRNIDGTIPYNGFCRLKPESDLIDKGKMASYTFNNETITLPYVGTAPDLGAFEYSNTPASIYIPQQIKKTGAFLYSFRKRIIYIHV